MSHFHNIGDTLPEITYAKGTPDHEKTIPEKQKAVKRVAKVVKKNGKSSKSKK